jgi:hypothetical protein
MKKLVLLFGLVAFSVNAQVKLSEKCNSYYEDKDLAKYIFTATNNYRNSIGEHSFVWAEQYYSTSKKWNDYLSTNSLWGHRNGDEYTNMSGTELIVGVTLIKTHSITSDLYKMIADSCIQQLIHSEFHRAVITSPIRSEIQTTKSVSIDNININILLVKYGAISANVCVYNNYIIITCIIHLGYYENPWWFNKNGTY